MRIPIVCVYQPWMLEKLFRFKFNKVVVGVAYVSMSPDSIKKNLFWYQAILNTFNILITVNVIAQLFIMPQIH